MATIGFHKQSKHFLAIAAIIIFFWLCPPLHPTLTPMGMKLIGLILSCCYGWTFVEFFWPTIIAFCLLPFTGACTYESLLAASFGNYLILFLMFILMMSVLLEESGLITFIANWLISRDFVSGRPWILIFVLMFAAAVCTAVCLNVFLVLFLFWGIVVGICETCGYTKGDKVSTMLITAITCGSMCGYMLLPYGGIVVILLSGVKGIMDISVPYATYMAFSFPIGFLTLIVFWAILRWVFRPDVSLLKNFDPKSIPAENLVLTKKAKIVALDVMIFMILIVLSTVLPATNTLRIVISQLGMPGLIAFVMVPLMFITVDGEKVWDLSHTFAHGVKMDILLICAFVIPMGSYMSSADAGISAFFLAILQPIASHLSPFVISIILAVASMVLTQFMANVVACYMFLPMIYALATAMDFDPIISAIITIYAAHIAIVLPAASGYAALTHAHPWATSSGVIKYGVGFLLTGFLVSIVSYFYLQILF